MAIKTDDEGGDDKELESPKGDDNVVEVKTGDDDDGDGDDDEPAAAATPQQIENAKERKRNRWRENKEKAERAEAEARELRERVIRAEERANLALQQAEQRQQREQPPQVDPYEAETKRLNREMAILSKEFDGLPPETQAQKRAEYQDKYDNLRVALLDVRADRAAAVRLARAPQKNPINQYIEMTYSDVVANARALNRAQFYFKEAVEDGRPDSKELLDECMTRARTELQTQGPSPRPPPSAAQRSRYSGPSQGARGGGSGGGGGKVQVVMNDHRKRLAKAAYPDLDEDAAQAKWAKDHAKRRAATADN